MAQTWEKCAADYIESWLALYFARHHLPGLSVQINLHGQPVFSKSFGYADLQKNDKLTPAHLIRVSSNSKIFTAVAVLQLVAAGKLKLADKASKYLPWLGSHQKLMHITIQQLLSHTSGLLRDVPGQSFWQLEGEFPDLQNLQQAVLKHGFVQRRGKEFKYSNIGYALLGAVIEQISGLGYAAYVQENIISPLGLENTYSDYSAQNKRRFKTKLAKAYGRADHRNIRPLLQNAVSTGVYQSAAGLISTLDDMSKFLSTLLAHSNKLLPQEFKSLQRKTVCTALETPRVDYGLGVSVYQVGKEAAFGETGIFPGHSTQTLAHVKSGLTICLFVNAVFEPTRMLGLALLKLVLLFMRNHQTRTPTELLAVEGRYENLWGVKDYLAFGKKLVCMNAMSDDPVETLAYLPQIGKYKFELVSPDKYAAVGEPVQFYKNPHEKKADKVMSSYAKLVRKK